MLNKFKVKHRENRIIIKEKLDKDEKINPREVDILNKKVIRGIMKPTVEGEKKISYLAPSGVA